MIVLCRVDDRLIHGQVVVGWSRFLNVEKIVVLSDELAADPDQRMLMEMGVPEKIEFDVVSVEDAARKLAVSGYTERRTMLLAASPHEFARLVTEYAYPIDELNLGGQRYIEGTHRVCEGVVLTTEALDDLMTLHRVGVKIDVRTIPTKERRDFFELYGAEKR